MKRHLTPEESEESRSKSRRISDSRNPIGAEESQEEEDSRGGFLDLNATPSDFDLNAPLAEEDSSNGQTGWPPDVQIPSKTDEGENQEKADTAESSGKVERAVEKIVQSDGGNTVTIESRSQQQGSAKAEDDSASSIVGLDAGKSSHNQRAATEARIDEPREACDEPEISGASPTPGLSVLATAILRRSLEPASTLGIDDDLDIIKAAWSAHQQRDLGTLDNVVSASCEELAKHPSNPSRYHYTSCLYISKKLPEAFGLVKTSQVLVRILRNVASGHGSGKRQMMLPVLASKLLLRAFAIEPNWPLDFVQVYLEDAIASRTWIELEGCKEFVTNILTAFPDVETELSGNTEESSCIKEGQVFSGEVVQGQQVKSESSASQPQPQGTTATKNRYPSVEVRTRIREEFLSALHQLLGSANTKENPRQLLKLLMQGAGYEEVRVVASSMLEGYLNNPIHLRAAKAVLDGILLHTRSTSENDLKTVSNLLVLRISSMQPAGQTKSLFGNIFGEMIGTLVKRKAEYATLALKTFVTAELNNKNPHNLRSLVMVLKAMPECPPPESELAVILQELIGSDDYRLQLRDFIRRMMKQVGSEVEVHALCHGLMQPWPIMGEQHETLKEAWLKQVVDLVCQLLLHAAAPFAQDDNLVSAVFAPSSDGAPAGPNSSSVKEKLLHLEKFSVDTASFQVEAVAWCTDVLSVCVPSMGESEFSHILRKLLFLEGSDAYLIGSDNTSEVEALSFRIVSSCLPAPEEILARIILMAISNYPVSQGEALKLIERLVWRAASWKVHFSGALTADNVQLPAAIFKLASFNLPGVTRQAVAQLVVKDMYWRACLVVLVIAAYNPTTIGRFVWTNAPTIRCLMEALLTCTRTFLPLAADKTTIAQVRNSELEAEIRDSKAEEAISAFLDLAERRRDESLAGNTDDQGHNTMTASRLPRQGGEWKGKVMFINQTGPVRRPLKSAVDELDRIDNIYHLGHLLRQSRKPDFFAEITKKQTLRQAWSWLQKILVQAPDVIEYLPPVWQCELLFMHVGQHPLMCALSLDIGNLASHLQQVICQKVQTTEGEIESVIDFLSQKLMSKSGIVRVRGRRCFSRLVDMYPSDLSGASQSQSTTPLDLKKNDASGVAGSNVGTPVKSLLHPFSGDSAQTSLKKLSGMSGIPSQSSSSNTTGTQMPSANLPSGALRTSPGTTSYQPSSSENMPNKFASRAPVWNAGDDCGWLKILESLPTASRILRVLAPAIQKAIEREDSFTVVMAYLEFLGRHLSETSLACCLATFIVERKILASTLLLGRSRTFLASEDSDASDQGSRSSVIYLLLKSFCKALEVGTVADITWDEMVLIHSPVVDLLLPRAAAAGGEVTFVQVKIHKVVVQAALETLAVLTQEKMDEWIEPQFLELLNILFPAHHNLDQTGDLVLHIGWLEDWNGEKSRLVSECQALSFMKSKNTRLVKAGLSVLSLESKLSICEGFCLSSEGAVSVLADLDRLKHSELDAFLGSQDLSGQRLKRLKNCLRTMVEVESSDSARRVLEVLEQRTGGTARAQARIPLLHVSDEGGGFEASPAMQSEAGLTAESSSQPVEEIADKAFDWLSLKERKEQAARWQEISGMSGYYLSLRLSLQTALIGSEYAGMSHCLDRILSILENVQSDALDVVRFLPSAMPVLALLCQQTPSIGVKMSDVLLATRIRTIFQARLENEKNSGVLRVFELAARLVRSFSQKLVEAMSSTASDSKFGVTTSMEKSVPVAEDRRIWDSLAAEQSSHLAVLKTAPVNRIEAFLRYFLCTELSHMWRKSCGPPGRSNAELSRMLCDLLKDWICGNDEELGPKKASRRTVAEQIELSGRCGLVMEMLEYLDPEFRSQGLLQSFSDLQPADPSGSCFTLLWLSGVVHKSSWQTLSRTLMSLLKDSNVTSQRLGGKEGGDAVIDFIFQCVRHPRTRLACRTNEEEQSENVMWSWLDPSTAAAVTKHAISTCVAAMQDAGTYLSSMKTSEESTQRFAQELRRQTLISHGQCLKMLLSAASQGSHIARAIAQHLELYQQEDFREGLASPSSMVVAGSFLRGLYRVFPVTVKAALRSSSSKFFLFEERILGDIHSIEEQTCSLDTVLHNALRSVCNGNEKESNAAYGFCQEFSRQHPLLVIPHLPTLRVLLEQLLPPLKQTDPQARSTMVRAFRMGLGLLDALRPYVILINNSSHKISGSHMHPHPSSKFMLDESMWNQSDSFTPKTDLEAVLDLYFEIVSGVDKDRQLVANFAARFSDFLCHCVTAGGRIRVYVSAHRTPTLETVAQIFPRLKKFGFLLSLLDKPEIPARNESLPHSILTVHQLHQSVSNDQAAPSMVILDDILKVRGQLQQCIKLYTSHESWKGASALYTADKSFSQFPQMFGNASDEGTLSSTLNDLDRASARMPTILPVLEDSLIQLMNVHDASARERIYSLLERSLVHCLSESSATNIIQGLLQQLRSASVLHAKSASRFAARFFHFSPELQPSILVEMLQLGKTASDELQQLLQDLFSVAGSPCV